ncbi:MAG: hypothetical protein PHE88_11985 [Elusimicrobia bacterium]|nr:hypothetical protein [Elusimicrobiota bacterium]
MRTNKEEHIMLDYIKVNFPQVYDKAESHIISSAKKEKEAERKVGMLMVVKSVYDKSYVAKITGLDPKHLVKREFMETEREWSKTEKGQFCMYIKDETKLNVGDVISLKLTRRGEIKDDIKEKYYKVIKPVSEANNELHNIIKKISRKEVLSLYSPTNVKEIQSKKKDVSAGLEI